MNSNRGVTRWVAVVAVASTVTGGAVAAWAQQFTVINGQGLFGGPPSFTVAADTVVHTLQVPGQPILPRPSTAFNPFRYMLPTSFSGTHALFLSESAAIMENHARYRPE